MERNCIVVGCSLIFTHYSYIILLPSFFFFFLLFFFFIIGINDHITSCCFKVCKRRAAVFTSKQTYVAWSNRWLHYYNVTLYSTLVGALGVGVSSIAYYISSKESCRINKLRAHENISIHEIDVAAFENGKSPEPNEYLIQGVIDGGEAVPLEECSKKVRNKHKPVHKKNKGRYTVQVRDTTADTKQVTGYLQWVSIVAKVTRQRSETIRVKQQGNYWSQIMHLGHIKDESIDEFDWRKYTQDMNRLAPLLKRRL